MLVKNLDLLVFKPVCESCFSVSNCNSGSHLPGLSLIYPVYLYNVLHCFIEHSCHNRGMIYLWQLLKLSKSTACAIFSLDKLRPIPLTCLWLRVCGVVYTLHTLRNVKNPDKHMIQWALMWCILFLFEQPWSSRTFFPFHVSDHLFSPWAKHAWIQVLIILHRMYKYILPESVMDQQYSTLDNEFTMSEHFWKQLSESIRSRVSMSLSRCIHILGGRCK